MILAAPVMLTNAYVGVNEVDPDAVQAARAMGMRPAQVLWRVELPLALPLIFAGVRTATVYVVATATLATFAGGGGLGDIIVNEPTYGTAGVIAASLTITALAFLVDGALALVQRAVTPRAAAASRRDAHEAPRRSSSLTGTLLGTRALPGQPRGGIQHVRYINKAIAPGAVARAFGRVLLGVALFALVTTVLLAACGSSSSSSSSTASSSTSASASSSAAAGSSGSLTLGTKDFTEEFILGQLYKQALEAKGCKINYKENIGATEIVDKALTSGQIDAYPEYTGESVATVAKINKNVTSPQEEYNLAKAFYAKRGQVMSEMTPFFDTDAIAVKKAYAHEVRPGHDRGPQEGPPLLARRAS